MLLECLDDARVEHVLLVSRRPTDIRPGYIRPLRGIRSKTRWYQALYDVLGPFYPLLRRLFPTYVTTTVHIGRAMIHVAATGCSKRILSSADINQLAD